MSLPAALASKNDVAMLRPLRIRQVLMDNCVGCHTTRRLGVDGADRDPAHHRAHELERIAAALLVLRCARCHGEDTLNLMVLKIQPERVATIRRMAALPGSGVRADQVLAIARAFDQLIEQSGGGPPSR